MAKKKLVFLLLILTFVSGSFTLERLQLGVGFEVKYLLFLFFLLGIILPNNSNLSTSINLNKSLILFFVSTFVYFNISFLSVFYSSDKIVSLEKSISILFLMLLMVATIYVVKNYEEKEFFAFLSGVFIVVGSLYLAPIYLSVISGSDRGVFSLGGPNVTTRILFFSACCSFYMYLTSKKSLYFILSILFLIGIVFLGSRGGIVGAAATLMTLWVVKNIFSKWEIKKITRISFKKITAFGAVVGVIAIVYESLKRIFFSRMINLTFGGDEIYTSGRDSIYEKSMNLIQEQPIFGHGLNGYSIETGSIYPHNLILELMIDTGIFGLIFFIVVLLYSIFLLFKLKKTNLFIFAGLPLYMVIVQMVSGGFYDFRYFFFWTIPLIYYGVNRKKEPSSSREVSNIA